MFMTDKQKYAAVLEELGEVLQSKNTTITCQQWQIDELKAKLEAAEKERDEARKDCEQAGELLEIELDEVELMRAMLADAKEKCGTEVRTAGEGMYLVLDNEAVDTLRAINAELREIYDHLGCIVCTDKLAGLQNAIKRILPVNGGAA